MLPERHYNQEKQCHPSQKKRKSGVLEREIIKTGFSLMWTKSLSSKYNEGCMKIQRLLTVRSKRSSAEKALSS
jgi:hypothetical protein